MTRTTADSFFFRPVRSCARFRVCVCVRILLRRVLEQRACARAGNSGSFLPLTILAYRHGRLRRLWRTLAATRSVRL